MLLRFRPGRSAHQALSRLREGLMEMRGGWVVDIDIRSFFDDLDRVHLRSFLDQRVRDGVLRRAIDKWLRAGVLEEGVVHHPGSGTPQGGVISPLLANIYLHVVLDVWFEEMVKPCLSGPGLLVRYADDAVIVVSSERDARRVMRALEKRLQRFGLRLHTEKSRIVRFCRPPHTGTPSREQRPETFDFLGFTHHWGRSRRGNWVVYRKTARSRLSRAIRGVNRWCRRYRHAPVRWQQQQLCRKLHGHYGYYGIRGNSTALGRFRYQVERYWRKWLNRRSRKASMPWERFALFQKRYPLPRPRLYASAYA